jgi:hypothetical protein
MYSQRVLPPSTALWCSPAGTPPPYGPDPVCAWAAGWPGPAGGVGGGGVSGMARAEGEWHGREAVRCAVCCECSALPKRAPATGKSTPAWPRCPPAVRRRMHGMGMLHVAHVERPAPPAAPLAALLAVPPDRILGTRRAAPFPSQLPPHLFLRLVQQLADHTRVVVEVVQEQDGVDVRLHARRAERVGPERGAQRAAATCARVRHRRDAPLRLPVPRPLSPGPGALRASPPPTSMRARPCGRIPAAAAVRRCAARYNSEPSAGCSGTQTCTLSAPASARHRQCRLCRNRRL